MNAISDAFDLVVIHSARIRPIKWALWFTSNVNDPSLKKYRECFGQTSMLGLEGIICVAVDRLGEPWVVVGGLSAEGDGGAVSMKLESTDSSEGELERMVDIQCR